ncbi:unnamed protein product [Prorocentrum cordatum]|uniref:RING-type domain-containing protein n=1 Tax=Prorocentrum cordatum TaxID=2364126 RepID=A0ABN9TSP5_9DINO|nr:unnamed protein product [Polarella glacialis]
MGCIPSVIAEARCTIEQVLQNRRAQPLASVLERKCPEHFTIRLHKGVGDALGASLASVPTGAVVYCVEEGYVLDKWNKENPDAAVQPGFVIEQVNGVGGYWPLMKELSRSGPLEVRVSTVPPQSAGPKWFEHVATMRRKLEVATDKSPFMVRLPSEASQDEKVLTSFPSVVACEAGIDQCAICLEGVGPDEVLTELPCKHIFHPLCAARWLAQSGSRCVSKRHTCPLCCRKMVNTRDGVVAVDAETF